MRLMQRGQRTWLTGNNPGEGDADIQRNVTSVVFLVIKVCQDDSTLRGGLIGMRSYVGS